MYWLNVNNVLLTYDNSKDMQLISFDEEDGRLVSSKFSRFRSFPTKTRKYRNPIYGDNQFLIRLDRILELSMCIVIASFV